MSREETYRQHLETLDRYLTEAIATASRHGVAVDGVLFHAGRAGQYHADDQPIPFRTVAHFRRFLPPLEGPEHALLARAHPHHHALAARPPPTGRTRWS